LLVAYWLFFLFVVFVSSLFVLLRSVLFEVIVDVVVKFVVAVEEFVCPADKVGSLDTVVVVEAVDGVGCLASSFEGITVLSSFHSTGFFTFGSGNKVST
jgi:hypothetical protein